MLTALTILLLTVCAFTTLWACERASHWRRLALAAQVPPRHTPQAQRLAYGATEHYVEPEYQAAPGWTMRWPDPPATQRCLPMRSVFPDPPPAVFAPQPKNTVLASVAASYDRWTHGRTTVQMPAVVFA